MGGDAGGVLSWYDRLCSVCVDSGGFFLLVFLIIVGVV